MGFEPMTLPSPALLTLATYLNHSLLHVQTQQLLQEFDTYYRVDSNAHIFWRFPTKAKEWVVRVNRWLNRVTLGSIE